MARCRASPDPGSAAQRLGRLLGHGAGWHADLRERLYRDVARPRAGAAALGRARNEQRGRLPHIDPARPGGLLRDLFGRVRLIGGRDRRGPAEDPLGRSDADGRGRVRSAAFLRRGARMGSDAHSCPGRRGVLRAGLPPVQFGSAGPGARRRGGRDDPRGLGPRGSARCKDLCRIRGVWQHFRS